MTTANILSFDNNREADATTSNGSTETTANPPSTQQFQIRLHAANLPRVRGTGLLKGPPDVFCLVTSVESPEQMKTVVNWGATEIIQKSFNPQWTKTFRLDYVVGTENHFYVHVVRVLDNDMSKKKNIGTALFEVGDILNTHSRTRAKRLRKGGCVFCHLESHQEQSNSIFRFQLACLGPTKLPRAQSMLLRQSNVTKNMVLELAVSRPALVGTNWMTIFRSKPKPQSAEVTWDVSELNLDSAFQGSMFLSVRVSVLTVSKGKDTVFGSVETSIRKLLNAVVEDGDDTQGEFSDLRLLKPRTDKEVARLRVKLAEIIGSTAFLTEGRSEQQLRRASSPNATISLPNASSNYENALESSAEFSPVSPRNDQKCSRPIPVAPSPTKHGDHDIVLDLNEADPCMFPTNQPLSTRQYSEASLFDESENAMDPYAVDLSTLPIHLSDMSHGMPTFQGYIADGCEIDFCVAIDFTSSNGDPRIPGTLHHQSHVTLNDYEETIASIGNAVSSYSSSKDFVVWGFGAKFNGVVRHLFQCGNSKTVKGVNGILQAYQSVFQSDITMSGPTVFCQAIQAAAVRAKGHHSRMNEALRYTVLLVVTDGIMDDFDETKRRLALYSEMPLSIIFVGVGRSDFRSMYALCLPNPGMRRNSVFVEFWQHQHDPTSLGRAALEDVPSQLVAYMVQNGIFSTPS